MNYTYDLENKHQFVDGRFFVPQGATAATTSIQTANQLGEVNNRLNAGVFGIDIAPINPEILEQIPREHFKEMNRLSKLSGATVSMHGPILDLVGFEQNRFDDLKREQNEQFAKFAMDRAHDLNPDGNTFMNVHINNQMVGEQWRKATKEEEAKAKEHKDTWGKLVSYDRFGGTASIKEAMGVVNRETGEINLLKLESKQYPGGDELWTPERRLRSLNQTTWDNTMLQMFQQEKTKRELEEERARTIMQLKHLEQRAKADLLDPQMEGQYKALKDRDDLIQRHIQQIDQYINTSANDAFHKLQFVPTDKKQAEKLKSLTEKTQEKYTQLNEEVESVFEKARKAKERNDKKALEEYQMQLSKLEEDKLNLLQNELGKIGKGNPKDPDYIPTPELFVPTNTIAKENTVKTVANVVVDSYKKFGDNAPILTLENYQPYLTLGTSKELKEVMEKTREQIVSELVHNNKMDPDKAREVANKHLGVTWDVGHINFMKKHGFTDKDVLSETKIAAPYVKQLHITDNFGFSDAHMPPGMGDSPIEQQFKILQEKGFDFDKKGRVIVEAGAYVGQFKDNPHVYTLEQFHAPIYSTGLSTTWDQRTPFSYGGYATGFGNLLPEKHFTELYGAGFSTLPRELGGNVGNDRDRFSGNPLQ